MKVAQILYSGLGGHGGVAFALVEAAEEPPWEWHLGFLGVEQLLQSYARRCQEAGANFTYIPAKAGSPWHSWRRTYSWLARTRPDAVLLHNPSAVVPCALFARQMRVPLIVVEHQQNRLKNRSEWLASKITMSLADVIVALSTGYRESLRAGLGRSFCEAKVRVIPNGLDLSVFKPGVRRPPGPVRIGMAGRFTPIKRFDVLVQAFREMREQHPKRDVVLSLAGGGETLDDVRKLASAGGIVDRVEFAGILGECQLADWYRTLDIYAHASNGETMSLSLLQAMATELPIVASSVPGIEELLSPHQGQGIELVSNDNTNEFSRALGAVYDRLAGAREAATSLRTACFASYDKDLMVGRYRNLIWQQIRGC